MGKIIGREIKLRSAGLLILPDGKNGVRMIELSGGGKKGGLYRVSDVRTGAFGYAEAENMREAAAKFGVGTVKKVNAARRGRKND